jgi:rhamnosyltransferase
MNAPFVSIVLPTRNGAASLPALLDAIARQQTSFGYELIAIDSDSTDGTVDLLHGRVDQLIRIRADQFDHGLSRNLGVSRARGELVVLIVQDALPASDHWLAALTAPLVADDRVAGAFARQLPRPEASAITRHYLSRWPASWNITRASSVRDQAAFDALSPAARLELCAFDNVCSCIRRSIWSQFPFRQTPIAEDIEWAKEVLLAGHRLVFVPAAEVIHSHERSARYEFARTYLLHRRLYELLGLRTIPTLANLTRAVVSSIATHVSCQREDRRSRGGVRAIALAFAWPLGQYFGALSAIRGWKPARSRMV